MKLHISVKKILFLAGFAALFFVAPANHAYAANVGDSTTFNIEEKFDTLSRSQIQASLVKISPNLYFYVDRAWWDTQDQTKKNEILAGFDVLSSEFDANIYPKLTSLFGSEWRSGIDNDPKITILFHTMKEGSAGYFRSADEYDRLQVPASNQREMFYLTISKITDPQLKMLAAHEFTHLIEFNQKNRLQGLQEEVWLNEARADFASTILGYDDSYVGSNLQGRVRDFLQAPSDSLTEWRETKYDYAAVNVFMHYLVDHYGVEILANSLKSKSVGIASIDDALAKAGYKENFAQIFTNWTIATILNDCNQDLAYCYFNSNLGSLRISPSLNFLPLSGSSSLSVTNVIKNWSANWQKIIGGSGDLKVEFAGLAGNKFQVPYIIFDKENHYSVKFLALDAKGKGVIDIPNFGSTYNSLVIIPSLEAQFTGFDTLELSYPYTFTASIAGTVSQDDPVLVQQLLAKIESLKKQIADLQNGGGPQPGAACGIFNVNLYVGISNNAGVACLQTFLKSQGVAIYPEGLVTGNFGALTKGAVIRFQKQWAIPATGFVGPLTRAKINGIGK